jgi:hypothetical protein
MKIFSNFDSNYKRKIVASYVEEYWSENILVINRSKLFAWLYIYIPIIVYTITAGLIIYAVLKRVDMSLIRRTIWLIVVGSWIFSMFPIIKKYIDFKLDFWVITPKWVFSYNQRGILSRNMTSLNVQNIRSIIVNRAWLLYSIFNNGEIIVLSEGSDNNKGEAVFNYVHNPEVKRQRMKQIFAKTNISNY